MALMSEKFGVPCGLSDHTLGKTAALIALGLGARMFEKHLTLYRNQRGPDHKASMTPGEMGKYVALLKNGYEGLGDGIKRIMPCEAENRKRYEQFIAGRVTC